MNSTDTGLANVRCALAALRSLAVHGVRHVVVSSGARCAPLVLAAAEIDELTISTVPDERSAAFVALGMAQADCNPVILICTSGTAAANYLPAIVEAHLSRFPLLVLTADRPSELRHCGAPQTIQQVGLYGEYAKCSVDLPAPATSEPALVSLWRREAENALRLARAWPAGPVHLNMPFREPLLPASSVPEEPESANSNAPSATGGHEAPSAAPQVWDRLATIMREPARGIIVAGPMHGPPTPGIAQLAAACGYPLLADIASQLRTGDGSVRVVSHYDLLLRHEGVAGALAPEVVIRFGGLPTSKPLSEWLQQLPLLHHVVIDDAPIVADPFRSATETIVALPAKAAAELLARLETKHAPAGDFAQQWQEADAAAGQIRAGFLAERPELYEGEIVAALFAALPPGTAVMLGNSMPIRLADTHAARVPAGAPVLFNRGANGIDGVVSTAVGAALGLSRKVVLIIGDVSLLHDVGGLHALGQHRPDVTIVLLNNDGGGIFSFLPLASQQSIFEPLIAMPHGRDFAHAARLFDVPYVRCDSPKTMSETIVQALARRGPEIVDFRTERTVTHATTKRLYEHIAASTLDSAWSK